MLEKTSLLVQFDQGKFSSGSFSATVGIGFTVSCFLSLKTNLFSLNIDLKYYSDTLEKEVKKVGILRELSMTIVLPLSALSDINNKPLTT